jgi:hypothetical protein
VQPSHRVDLTASAGPAVTIAALAQQAACGVAAVAFQPPHAPLPAVAEEGSSSLGCLSAPPSPAHAAPDLAPPASPPAPQQAPPAGRPAPAQPQPRARASGGSRGLLGTLGAACARLFSRGRRPAVPAQAPTPWRAAYEELDAMLSVPQNWDLHTEAAREARYVELRRLLDPGLSEADARVRGF